VKLIDEIGYNRNIYRYSLAEDLPPAVRKIRKTILVPAMKEERKIAGTRATITGDRLIVNGRCDTFDQIPKKNGVETTKAESQSLIRLV